MSQALAVYIVDDDISVRDALSLLLGVHGYRTAAFADAESFLAAYAPHWRGCILLDIRMPGMSGLDLQKELRRQEIALPVIVMTGHGDLRSARDAFRNMAIDFLEKPLDHDKLIAAIGEAFDVQSRVLRKAQRHAEIRNLLGTLTPREMQVMQLVVSGLHNREIALELGISARTVEVHKAHLMDKLQISNVPDLVRIAMDLESQVPNAIPPG